MHTRHLRVLHLLVIAALIAGLIGGVPASAAPALAAGSISLTALAVPIRRTSTRWPTRATSTTVPTGWDFPEIGHQCQYHLYGRHRLRQHRRHLQFRRCRAAPNAPSADCRAAASIPTIGAQFTNNTGTNITSLALATPASSGGSAPPGRTDRIDFQLSTTPPA